MANDLVSVVVPIYNVEDYLQRCIRSILEQTHQNLEIIAVDDGSTDDSGKIIDRLAASDGRIRVTHKQHGGVTAARIDGARMARGDWISFVDADDILEPQMYEHLLSNAEKYNADISHCGYQMVFPDGHIDYYYNTGHLAQQDKITALEELLSGSRIEPGLCNKLFHKTLFHSLLHGDAVPLDIKINEDLLMNYFLFKEAKQTIYEDVCPYHYMLRKGSAATSRGRNHAADPLRVREIIKADARADARIYPAAYSCYMYTLLRTAAQTEWQEERKAAHARLKQELRAGGLASCTTVKLKLMAIGVAYLRPLYCLVRRVYERRTGISKKYDF